MTTNYEKYPHYFKPIPNSATHLDVYAVLQLFGVTDQAIGHAIKKLLVPGVRGTKSKAQDVQEAIDTLVRWQNMQLELSAESTADSSVPSTAHKNGISTSPDTVSSLVHLPDINFIARVFNKLSHRPQCTCTTEQQVLNCNIKCARFNE